MDVEKFYSLLFGLYAEQEKLKIEYELNNSFFSTEGFTEKHFCCQGTVSLFSDTVRPYQAPANRETGILCAK